MSKITSAMAVLGVVAGIGAAALPLSSYAADPITAKSQDVTIRAEVNNTIAVTSSEELVDLGTINGGTPVAEKSTIVTVSGTAGTKFNLNIEDTDDETALTNANTNKEDTATFIPAGAGVTTGTAAWGFKGGDVKTWTAVQAKGTPTFILSEATLTTDPIATDVTFGVSASANQANGVYEDQVVFTAVTVTE